MRAHKIDANQDTIVKGLRKAGCEVLSLAAVANGCPDLLVKRGNERYQIMWLLEVKNEDQPPSKRRLTPHQRRFHKDWYVQTVTNLDEALNAVGLT